MINDKKLKEILKNTSKDEIINLLIEYARFTSIEEIERKLIHIKLDINLNKQQSLLDKMDENPLKSTDTQLETLAKLEEHDKLNKQLSVLDEEWNKLYKSLGD